MKYCDRIQFTYEDYLNKAQKIYDDYSGWIDEQKNACSMVQKRQERTYKKNRKKLLIYFAILFIIISVLFSFVYKDKYTITYEQLTNGQETVCYVTTYGHCYHKSFCKYLYNSKIEQTMYNAETSGYSPCSYCWHSPKAIYKTVTETNTFLIVCNSVLNSLGVTSILLVICLSIQYQKYKKKQNVTEQSYKNIINDFRKSAVKELERNCNFLEMAKYYSNVPDSITYREKLPYSNNNNEFTVYKSYYGYCYHYNRNCSGKGTMYPIHSFIAANSLKPCYHCCKEPIVIPEWHKKYIKLLNLYTKINHM